MSNQLYTILNNGQQMPLLGLGVYDMYNSEAEQAVLWALETGYRLIDTAEMYKNETEIGNAVRESGIDRTEIFVTTKVNNDDQGFDKTLRAFDESLKKLNIDYIDLYLVHWPIKATRKDTWLALEKLYTEGQVKAIGVANYLVPFLNELQSYSSTVPAVNQVEFSPYLYLKDLAEVCKQKKIQLQAYTPLARGMRMNDPKIQIIAQKYEKTTAQIILRWALQHGVSSIPKSANLQRIKENFNIFDFEINQIDMTFIDTFNENLRIVEDPMDLF
jgi:diketogulonate reductase-like aldo/keto reductase